jgi:5-methylcytosine-specific restriction protein A
MSTYLVTWNPEPIKGGWDWTNLSDCAQQTAAGKIVKEPWSCRNKHVKKGDGVFLMMLGRKGRGIIGFGRAASGPRFRKHWRTDKAKTGSKIRSIDCDWGKLLDPETDEVLSLKSLRTNAILKEFGWNWTPRSSGIEIPQNIAQELMRVWSEFIHSSRFLLDDPIEELSENEGDAVSRLVRHRRREQKLRKAKIEAVFKQTNGLLKCEVPNCGFDFHKVYGQLGYKFAHVHHLVPLGSRDIPSKTKLKDLVIVCPNCHAMIHRYGECRALEGLIQIDRCK